MTTVNLALRGHYFYIRYKQYNIIKSLFLCNLYSLPQILKTSYFKFSKAQLLKCGLLVYVSITLMF